MEKQRPLIRVALILCCCPLIEAANKGGNSKVTTQPTTDQTPGVMELPKFDFSKLTASAPNSNTESKSGLAAIPTLDFSRPSKNVPAESCRTDMCKLMKGICNNNGKCTPQACSSDIICECDPGYTGQFCDRNITEVNMAKEVRTINGKIVSTESPRGKKTNGKHHVNGNADKIQTIRNKMHTGGNDKPGLTDNVGGQSGTGTVVSDNVNTAVNAGTVSSGNPTKENVQIGSDSSVLDKGQGRSNKYAQPKGSFVKGPEVPNPTASKPIKVNVRNQKIKSRSTTIIETFTEKVTIATVSVNLEQSMALDASGQTMNTAKLASSTSKKNAKKNPNKSNIDFREAKNVVKLDLPHGTIQIVDQGVKSTDKSAVDKSKTV